MRNSTTGPKSNSSREYHRQQFKSVCKKCGATRTDDQIGLEDAPDCLGWASGSSCGECYVCQMRAVAAELWRVLRDDGTFWLNLGDKYSSDPKKGKSGPGKHADYLGGRDATVQTRSVQMGIPSKNLLGIPWRVALALQADGWILRSDIIWCLGANTCVYARTQKGEMPMTIKDMVRLDPRTVKLWNGSKWTQVLGWSKSRCENPLQLVLRSGEHISCTPSHVWPTQRGNVCADELKQGDVIQTCQLPEPDEPKKPAALDDELVGWFVGLYLAEGSCSGDIIQMASHVNESHRFKRLKQVADAFDGSLAVHQTSENGCTANLHGRILKGIIDTYISGRTAKTKHLKTACWKRSNAFLHALLDGYLHGDGHYDEGNDRWRLGFCRNYALESDLRTIAARLGIVLKLKPSMAKIGDQQYPTFKGEIRFNRSGHFNEKHGGEIMEIRSAWGRAFWDIGVEDDPHVFSLASGVLTHNSKPNSMPGSQQDRPTTAHEYIFLFAKQQRYFYDGHAIREPIADPMRTNFKCGKKIGSPTKQGLDSFTDCTDRTKRSVWTVPVASEKESHFAVFNEKLILPCILAGTSKDGCCTECGAPRQRIIERKRTATRPGTDTKVTGDSATEGNRDPERHVTSAKTIGWKPTCQCDNEKTKPCTVLDPFMGSGTTVAAAIRKNRDAIGIELNDGYIEIAERKIKKAIARKGFGL